MTNDVTNTGNNALANTTSADPWAAAAAAEGGSARFLQFDGNTGDFLYGSKNNQVELALGTRAIVDMRSFKRGYICWNDSKVLDEVMELSVVNPNGPPKSSLVDHGPYSGKRDGWHDCRSFNMIASVGDEEILFGFKISSRGGINGCAALLKDFAKVYKHHPGKLPVVVLSNVSFPGKDDDGKEIGKKYGPVFTIESWVDASVYDELAENQGEPVEEGSEDASNYEQEPVAATTAPVAPAAPPPPPPAAPPATAPAAPPATAPAAPPATAPAGGRRAKRF